MDGMNADGLRITVLSVIDAVRCHRSSNELDSARA